MDEKTVKEFAKFLIDRSSGGEIHISDLPGLVIDFMEENDAA